jgi:hypothetical protein
MPEQEQERTTTYIVMRSKEKEGPFEVLGPVEVALRARAVQAIQDHVGPNPTPDKAGWYAAVPADKWEPRKVNVRQETILTFDDDPTFPGPEDPETQTIESDDVDDLAAASPEA